LAIAVGIVVTLPLLEGSYMKGRWAALGQDARIRLNHWEDVIALMDDGSMTTLFGMGLGSFPSSYFYNHSSGGTLASYRYGADRGNAYLSLGGGEGFYFGQRVSVRARAPYLLDFDLRSASTDAQMSVALCEKSILYSHNCKWFQVKSKATNQWERQQLPLDPGTIGHGSWFAARPVELAFANGTSSTVVDVDNIRLLGPAGVNLVQNGDFSAANNHWFFATDNHLPWHTKNLGLQILFEQGVFGLLMFVAAVVLAVGRAAHGAIRGNVLASTLLAALVGFVLVGAFDSLFDAPRLALAFYLWLLAAAAMQKSKSR
jgi:hypothetical protein